MKSSKTLVLSVTVATLMVVSVSNVLAQNSTPGPVVYKNDFEKTVGQEWSTPITDTTPKGARRFLGQFCNDTAQLTLANLPPHSKVTVSFDLLIIRKWDGNYRQYGPDYWDLSVTDGPKLLHTTFSNSKNYQAYPDLRADGHYPPHTGADEINTLGYQWRGKPTDSVYKLNFTFSHKANSLQLNFSASGLERLPNESWGLDNIRVSVSNQPIPQPPPTFQPTVPDYIPRKGLVGLWLADGNAYDSFGKNHGRASNGATYGPGKFGKAFKLDGQDDYITIPELKLKPYTFTAWVKTSRTGRSVNNRRIFMLDAGEHFYSIEGNSGGGLSSYATHQFELNERDWQFAEDQWTHIAVSFNGSMTKIYRDGRLTKMLGIGGPFANNQPFTGEGRIGGNERFNGGFWHGLIDEAAIWNRALSSDEIVKISQSAKAVGPGKPCDGNNLKEITIEALMDGQDELWIKPDGIFWKNLSVAKVGRHNQRNEPTWLNGLPWMPRWAKPNEDRGPDRTELLPILIGSTDLQFELLAVGKNRTAKSIERRSPAAIRREGNALALLFPDAQYGPRWYRFRLYRIRKSPPQPNDGTFRIRFNSPQALEQFVTQTPEAWQVVNGKLIGQGIGPNEKPFLTYKMHFKKISKVVITGSARPAQQREVILKGQHAMRAPRISTNFRVGVGTINLIFNWELRDENHYRNGQACTVQKGHALAPGKEHTIVIEQIGQAVVVCVDNKPVYATQATLDGTVTVYPAHGSTISVSQIDITGVPDPQRSISGHSHTSTF